MTPAASGQLAGKVAIVTGGARGIGAGIASCLAHAGARVAIVDLDLEQARATTAELETPGIALRADCSEERAMAEAAEQAVRSLGGLDVMVNNAGAGTGEPPPADWQPVPPFTNLTGEGWDAQLRNNLRTTFAGAKAAIPHLLRRGGGSIVNIASIAGTTATPALPAYGAAKAGVIHLTRSLALELAPSNIRVNAICPGLLWTRAWQTLAELLARTVPEHAGRTPREVFLALVTARTPLGREQTPEDIGQLVVFLASGAAGNITGQEIKVDGGITLAVGNPV